VSLREIAPKQPTEGKGQTGRKNGGVSSTPYLEAAVRLAVSWAATVAKMAAAVGTVFAASCAICSGGITLICCCVMSVTPNVWTLTDSKVAPKHTMKSNHCHQATSFLGKSSLSITIMTLWDSSWACWR